ncbi:hypothetical protein [Siphonobacter aquaeclarae]|uniref:hypothetical protein n=1 Tax=Siphonobacter aquaeclarae TaxID=563176 RepID=UPI0011600224|nr:hypothetical protein [Siphonobacter aquaeclarae]MBO9640355.1 hypothetical protein [Siphonobacter aquaeclarae]
MKTTSFPPAAAPADRPDLFSSSGTTSPLFPLDSLDITTHTRRPASIGGNGEQSPVQTANLDWLIEVMVMGVTVLLAYSFF